MNEVSEKKKVSVGLMFWVFLIVGSVISAQVPLLGELLIVVGFALGLIWLFRRFRKHA